MSEPIAFNRGDAVHWTRRLVSVVDSASYHLVGADSATIEASVDGLELTVALSSAESSEITAGQYKWFLIAMRGSDRLTLDEGYLTVNADPTALTELDVSTHSERVLQAIEARIEGRILSDHENYSIDGRSLSRIPIDQLYQLRRRYQWSVHNEQVRRGTKKTLKRVIHR